VRDDPRDLGEVAARWADRKKITPISASGASDRGSAVDTG
jgi:hypothetical protein